MTDRIMAAVISSFLAQQRGSISPGMHEARRSRESQGTIRAIIYFFTPRIQSFAKQSAREKATIQTSHESYLSTQDMQPSWEPFEEALGSRLLRHNILLRSQKTCGAVSRAGARGSARLSARFPTCAIAISQPGRKHGKLPLRSHLEVPLQML